MRRWSGLSSVLVVSALALAVGCGGATLSVLHAKGRAAGGGPIRVEVLNSSGVSIERLYVAKTEDVDRARAAGAVPDSEADVALWGEDRLDNAGLLDGHTFDELVLPAGHYDVLAVDHDHREQFVERLNVHPGRKYVLEIGTGWTQAR